MTVYYLWVCRDDIYRSIYTVWGVYDGCPCTSIRYIILYMINCYIGCCQQSTLQHMLVIISYILYYCICTCNNTPESRIMITKVLYV